MFAVGDLLQVKNPCEGRVDEVWGEPLEVIVVERDPFTEVFYYHCKFTPEGKTWFARDGIVNTFREEEIEYRINPKPSWEV